MDSDQRKRFLGRFAMPADGTPERAVYNAWLSANKSDDADELAERAWERFRELVAVQLDNGAGNPTDDLLRSFFLEFNGRAARAGLDKMPSSFNVIDAFIRFIPPLQGFELLPERDHLFGLTGFLDELTSGALGDSISEAFKDMEEGLVYHFNNSDPLDSITFSLEDGSSFVIAGASLVRHGNEVSVLLMAGQTADLVEVTESLADIEELETPTAKAGIRPDPSLKREAKSLLGDPRYWETIALLRLDAAAKRVEARYVLKDAGNAYMVITDDPATYLDRNGEFFTPALEAVAKENAKRLREYSALLDLAETVVFLPTYFRLNDDLARQEQQRTKYGQRPRAERQSARNSWPREHRRVDRTVITINETPDRPSSSTSYSQGLLQIESSGYWKRLDPTAQGVDRNGNKVSGRTWVTKRLSWVEETANTPLQARAAAAGELPDGPCPGWLYVVRAPGHPKDVYKVGYTTRDVRSRLAELARGSGVPLPFVLVMEWGVGDCKTVEANVHAELEAFRLTANREFFELPFQVLREVIESHLSDTA